MTLIVVTEIPIAWHDTEAFIAETKVRLLQECAGFAL